MRAKKINTQRILLTTLVSVSFFGFLLWSIQRSQSEEELLYSASQLRISNPLENRLIKVTSPSVINSAIKSPATIAGQANIFGNKLKVRIKDNQGIILNELFVQTKNPQMMSDFSLKIWYKKPTATKGTVEIFLVSDENNSESAKISIPVVFHD